MEIEVIISKNLRTGISFEFYGMQTCHGYIRNYTYHRRPQSVTANLHMISLIFVHFAGYLPGSVQPCLTLTCKGEGFQRSSFFSEFEHQNM